MLANLILGVLSGAMLAASYPLSFSTRGDYWSLPWLAFIAPVPLFIALRSAMNSRQAFTVGAVAAVVFNTAALYWLTSFGPLALSLLVAYQALFFGILGIALHVLLRYPSEKHNFVLIPAMWVAAEFLRSLGASGFPWLFLGYTQYNNAPVLQLSAIGGVYATSFFTALTAYTIFHLLFSREPALQRMRGVALSSLALVVLYGWGYYAFFAVSRAELSMPTARVGVVQGGLSTRTSWGDLNYISAAERAYVGGTRMLLQGETVTPELVVWPEGALPMAINQQMPQLDTTMQQLWEDFPQLCLLLGTLTIVGQRLENSALIYSNPYSPNDIYSKIKPVAFGEFVPLAQIARMLDFPWGNQDISEGLVLKPLRFGSEYVMANICYDSVYPSVTRQGVCKGASLVAVIANNSWYTLPSGPAQHAMMDYFRAVENRRSLVRSTPTGVSCFILPSGRQASRLPLNVNAWKVEALPINDAKPLYTLIGDAFAVAMLLLAAVGLSLRSFIGGGEEML